jgi:hypothetical protein
VKSEFGVENSSQRALVARSYAGVVAEGRTFVAFDFS